MKNTWFVLHARLLYSTNLVFSPSMVNLVWKFQILNLTIGRVQIARRNELSILTSNVEWKNLKKLYFHIILLWDLKILYILIYYTISQHCWPFCWKMLTFTFSNIQLPNIILFAWLNVKNIILGVVESTVLFKSKLFSKNEIFQKRHFLKKTFFSRLSRLINFDFLSMFLLQKCQLGLVDIV